MRYVKTKVPPFEELGILPVLKDIACAPRGIVLLAGSTGSGKSTTLAAMIEHINATSRKHIITLEDPIEFVFEDNQCVIEQREIGLDTMSFAHGLKNVLRQDPDVIMVTPEPLEFVLATMAYKISGRDGGKRSPRPPEPVSIPKVERSEYPAPISTGNNNPPKARMVTPEAPVNEVKNAHARTVTMAGPPRNCPKRAWNTRIKRFDAPPSARK